MISKDIVNLIFGYVEFTAENGFPESFINSCNIVNIPLWDITKNENGLCAKTTVKGYKKIRNCAKTASMTTRITKKSGLPFLLNKCLRRKSLITGFAVMTLVLIFLSGHVWVIEVNGNENITDSEVIEAFENSGLTVGSRISSLRLPQIESAAMLKLGNASWAGVNIKGCTAYINVRELKKIPEIETHSGTSNIVASKDGQISVLEVYRGSSAVKVGQPVLKGELLISGISESRLQTNLFTDAHGYAVAKTNITVTSSTDRKIIEYIPSSKKIHSVYFLGLEILPDRQKDSECYEHRSRMVVNGKTLPFGINYRLYTSYEKKEKTMSEAQAKLMALNEYALKSYYETQHAQIIEQEVTMTEHTDHIEITGKYFCYENIGKSVSFDVDETEEAESLSDE